MALARLNSYTDPGSTDLTSHAANYRYEYSGAMNTQGLEFLTPEESAKVDAALLSQPEKFLTRLTLSSLKLLSYIAAEESVAIEALTDDQVIAWFERDAKRKREQGIDATVLKWDV